MNIIDQAKLILNTFRVSKSLAALHDYGGDNTRPQTTNYENLYSTSAAVYACIRLRADSVARPPTRVYRSKNGSTQIVTDHPLVDLFQRVNPFWTISQLKRAIETDLSWHGNAFVAVERDKKTNRPIELWRMRPDWIEVVPDPRNYLKGYIYTVEGTEYRWSTDDVIHFRYANPLNEYWGLAPLSAARMSADLGIDAIAYDRYFFTNSAAPAIALQSKDMITKPQADEILKRWEQAFKGVRSAGRTVVLHSGLEVRPLAISQKDAEWIGAMKWAVDDVARCYRVPTPLVGEEKAVYRNIAEAEASFWHQAIIPELLWIEEILNAELIPLFGDPSLRIGFDLTDVEQLQDDITARITRFQGLMDRGAMTINEVRRREKLGPDLPWGDKWFAPMNLMPISDGQKPPESPEARRISIISGDMAQTRLISRPVKLLAQNTDSDPPTIERRIVQILSDFFDAESEKIAEAYSKNVGQYATAQDYDWSRWRQLQDPLADPISEQVVTGAGQGFREVGSSKVFEIDSIGANAWAETRVAELVTNISETTRAAIRQTVQRGVSEGWARDRLRNEIMDATAFSKGRAVLIARTESQRAYNEGLFRGYKATGQVTKKSWLDMGSGDICEECVVNSASEPIPLNATFPSGADAPPAHPNCRCRLMPHIEEEQAGTAEAAKPVTTAPPIVAHTRVTKRAQTSVKSVLGKLPSTSQSSISEIEMWTKQGPKFTVGTRRYYTAADFNRTTGQVRIFNANRITDREISEYLSHEAGHAAHRQFLTNAAPELVTEFENATIAEGAITDYSRAWLAKDRSQGIAENLAEFHMKFMERQLYGTAEYYTIQEAFPRSFEAFRKMWLKIGGISNL